MKRIFLIFLSLIFLLIFSGYCFAWDGWGGPKGRVWRNMSTVPAVTDDSSKGYRILDIWEYLNEAYILVDNTEGAALWTNITSVGTAGVSIYSSSGNSNFTGQENIYVSAHSGFQIEVKSPSGISFFPSPNPEISSIKWTPISISSDTALSTGGMYIIDTSGGDIHIQIEMPTSSSSVSEFSFLRDGTGGVSIWVSDGYSMDMPGTSGTTISNSLSTESGSKFNALCSGDSVFFGGTGTIALW